MKKTLSYFGMAGIIAIGGMFVLADTASAQYFGNRGGFRQSYGNGLGYGSAYGTNYGFPGSNSYTAPIYHSPSVHYDRVYHPTRRHWTPFRGVHTHGHYDTVPHYTPGHIDTQHGNHIHPNPYYHR